MLLSCTIFYIILFYYKISQKKHKSFLFFFRSFFPYFVLFYDLVYYNLSLSFIFLSFSTFSAFLRASSSDETPAFPQKHPRKWKFFKKIFILSFDFSNLGIWNSRFHTTNGIHLYSFHFQVYDSKRNPLCLTNNITNSFLF